MSDYIFKKSTASDSFSRRLKTFARHGLSISFTSVNDFQQSASLSMLYLLFSQSQLLL